MASQLDRETLLQTLRGYAEVNAITEAERHARLAKMTSAESWAVFESLYEVWERAGRRAGGACPPEVGRSGGCTQSI